MRKLVLGALALAGAGAAQAEIWKDYMPGKGIWQVTMVKVDPNHVDDYLVGLKQTWIPAHELMKRKGMVDDYKVMVSNAVGDQTNVLLMEHVPSYAVLEPDQARDQQLDKEIYAAMPKAKMDAKVADYEKYRSFVGSGDFAEMTFAK